MFALSYNSKYSSSLSAGIATYTNITLEEDYLRSLYPVYEFDFDSYVTTQKCVIKIADMTNKSQYYALIHELYVTMHITGNIRKVIDVKFTNDYLYAIFSYIEGESLQKVIESYFFDGVSFREIVVILNALMSQLRYLYTKYNFTHYDLHLDSVIVNGSDVYIIDLGYSYAYIDGKHHGITFSSTSNIEVMPNHYWPYDIYKLVCFIKLLLCKVRSLYVKRIQLLQVEYSREYEYAVINGDTTRMFETEEYLESLNDNYTKRIALIDDKLDNSELIRYIDDLLSYFINPQHFRKIRSKYYAAPRIETPHFDDFYRYFNAISLKWSVSY